VWENRERERDEVKFTKGGGRNVFKTGVQLTAAADLESVWEPRGGGGEEHRNLMSDHRPSTGLRFFLGASNLEGLWEKGPFRGFEVLIGSSLKPGRSAGERTFQRFEVFTGPSLKPLEGLWESSLNPGRSLSVWNKGLNTIEALLGPLLQTWKGHRI
jgi:hypothetical protein